MDPRCNSTNWNMCVFFTWRKVGRVYDGWLAWRTEIRDIYEDDHVSKKLYWECLTWMIEIRDVYEDDHDSEKLYLECF